MGMTDKMGTIHRAPTLGKIKDKEKTGLMNPAPTLIYYLFQRNISRFNDSMHKARNHLKIRDARCAKYGAYHLSRLLS